MDKLKIWQFFTLKLIWPWSSRSINPQNNRDLNQGVLLFWSKFGDSSFNRWQVIARTSKWLPQTQTHTQTDAGNYNTRRPKLALGKNDNDIIKNTYAIHKYMSFLICHSKYFHDKWFILVESGVAVTLSINLACMAWEGRCLGTSTETFPVVLLDWWAAIRFFTLKQIGIF